MKIDVQISEHDAARLKTLRRTHRKRPLWMTGRMALGRRTAPPTGGTPVHIEPPQPRATVMSDGIEFEVVWFPAKHASSLLPEDFRSRPDSTHIAADNAIFDVLPHDNA